MGAHFWLVYRMTGRVNTPTKSEVSMNKNQRAEIEKIILVQIDALAKEPPSLGESSGDSLRLSRLNSTLMRIDADNFGECFKCEREIPVDTLRKRPEISICDSCLTEPKA